MCERRNSAFVCIYCILCTRVYTCYGRWSSTNGGANTCERKRTRRYISKLMYYRTRLYRLHFDRTFHWPEGIKIVVGFDRKTIKNTTRRKKKVYLLEIKMCRRGY